MLWPKFLTALPCDTDHSRWPSGDPRAGPATNRIIACPTTIMSAYVAAIASIGAIPGVYEPHSGNFAMYQLIPRRANGRCKNHAPRPSPRQPNRRAIRHVTR